MNEITNMDTTLRVAVEEGDYDEMRFIVLGLIERGMSSAIKNDMMQLYREGNDRVREALVHGILEHLFEEPSMQDHFSEWKDDPVLKSAYDEAKAWSDSINSKRGFLEKVGAVCVERLNKSDFREANLGLPILGVDSISLEWRSDSGETRELILDCSYEFLDSIQNSELLMPGILGSIAQYVLDPLHWVEGEYGQTWVLLDGWRLKS